MIRIMDTSGIQISSIVRTTASGFRMLPVFGCLVSDHQCTMIPSNFSKRQLKIYDTRPSMCNTSMYNKSHLKCFLVGPSGLYVNLYIEGQVYTQPSQYNLFYVTNNFTHLFYIQSQKAQFLVFLYSKDLNNEHLNNGNI